MEYQRYLRADHALCSQGVLTPSIIEKNPTHKYLLLEYFPINNASKYYKKEELKNIYGLGFFQLSWVLKPLGI